MPTLSPFWTAAVGLTGRLDLSGLPPGVDPSGLSTAALIAHGVRPRHAGVLRSATEPLTAPRFLRWSDPGYPSELHRVPHAPPVLFLEGDARRLGSPGVAIVGARRCSGDGRRMARMLARAVARSGGIVISGLAQGIDSEAHGAADGSTIAVLGQGLACPLPGARARLRRALLDRGGLVISELPPRRPASRITFPMRNRIIAGLSRVTVVVEARQRSGARITARNALEAGRDVLAVPGHPFQELAQGCLDLLQQGAGLARGADDVLAAAGLTGPSPAPQDHPVLRAVGTGADFDALLRETRMDPPTLLRTLAELELRGDIERLAGGRYACRTR